MKSVGVELGSGVLRVVTGSGRRGRLLGAEAAALPLPDLEPETIASTVATYLSTHARGVRHIVLGLPLRDCAVKLASFPATTDDNLAKLAHAQAAAELPLPLEQVDLAHTVVDHGRAHGTATVVIAACRKETVADVLQSFAGFDLKPAVIDVTVLALVNALAPQAAAGEGPCGLLNVGDEAAELAVLDGSGKLSQVRGLASGEAGALAEEVRRTLQAVAGTTESSVRRVILSGSRAREVEAALRGALTVPVERADPWQGTGPPGADPAEFAVATGLALRGSATPLRLNLRHKVTPAKREQRRQTSLAGVVVGAIFLALLAGAGLFYVRYQQQATEHARLLAERDALTKEVKAVGSESKAFLDHLTATRERVRADSDWLGLLKRLAEELPGGVSISELSLERTRPISLRGEAFTNASVAQAVDAIWKTGLFERVDLDSSNAETIGDELVYNYQIRCYWPAAGKAKTTAAAAREEVATP